MALFGLRGASEEPLIRGEGLYLRPPAAGDFQAWAALRDQSRAFLAPWEPVWPEDDLTRAAWRRRLRRYEEDMARDEAWPFLIFRAGDDRLIGGLTLGLVRRGVAQAATLGYWMGQPYAGKGHMTRAVAAACAWGFGPLRLHRIEAACVLANEPSRRLLERNGFRREGLARGYLRIDGRWQDHYLYARLDSDPAPG